MLPTAIKRSVPNIIDEIYIVLVLSLEFVLPSSSHLCLSII